MNKIDTGGGPFIGGGLNVGGDFVGRNKFVKNQPPITINAVLSARCEKVINWEGEAYELILPAISIGGLYVYKRID